ncbi:C4-dicarboxylate ABC transporter [Nitrosomonas sp. Nm166]|uniref:C4-dicarboxylate ABC transporter n=1 Tax=Nitrosomonas sp. Nm166 TaxID=1881054 RepID=UPI0008F1BCC0|nr:C4-dicarboxylate ABC transporter [Nitrosomonas sp. Nm166]SFE81902.1 hypothetical protein SAMN05428977_10312 [Nitrosomonas sp. Nm166]
MKTSQIFAISALVISGTFFGILSLFELPYSMMEWVISDVILGAILYLSYLTITLAFGSSKTKVDYRGKKITV